MSVTKRKCIVLSLNTKIEVINKIKKGESLAKIAQNYNIGKSIVSDIKHNAEQILKYSMNNSASQKIMKQPKDSGLNEALYQWFIQAKAEGIPIVFLYYARWLRALIKL